ncbi:hypothetical protein BH09SUM1_BH09SUM1_12490 [soil metagenome]
MKMPPFRTYILPIILSLIIAGFCVGRIVSIGKSVGASYQYRREVNESLIPAVEAYRKDGAQTPGVLISEDDEKIVAVMGKKTCDCGYSTFIYFKRDPNRRSIYGVFEY